MYNILLTFILGKLCAGKFKMCAFFRIDRLHILAKNTIYNIDPLWRHARFIVLRSCSTPKMSTLGRRSNPLNFARIWLTPPLHPVYSPPKDRVDLVDDQHAQGALVDRTSCGCELDLGSAKKFLTSLLLPTG